jgi:hypothetical protein
VPLKVDGCNASGPWSFSDASVDVSSPSSCVPVSDAFAFRGAIQTVLKYRASHNTLARDQNDAFDLLGFYLQNCKNCEASIQ